MPIIEKSDENIRELVRGYIAKKKRENPGYRVIDVGGAANPWCDDLVDAYADLNDFGTAKPLFRGDINRPEVWDAIGREKFDFSICTHVLEDIRNPEFVINNLVANSKAGFIATPNKHMEMSCVESFYWVGFFHHRWVFTLAGDVLRICPKLPVSGYFSSLLAPVRAIAPLVPGRFTRLLRKMKLLPVSPGLKWVRAEKALSGKELGFIWEGGFAHEFINGDYAGGNAVEAASLYASKLEEGI